MLPFDRLTRPPRNNSTRVGAVYTINSAAPDPVALAGKNVSRHTRRGNPCSFPVARATPATRRQTQRGRQLFTVAGTTVEHYRRRDQSPVHLSKATSSSDPSYLGFGKYSLMMRRSLAPCFNKRSSARQFSAVFLGPNSSARELAGERQTQFGEGGNPFEIEGR